MTEQPLISTSAQCVIDSLGDEHTQRVSILFRVRTFRPLKHIHIAPDPRFRHNPIFHSHTHSIALDFSTYYLIFMDKMFPFIRLLEF